MIATTTSAKSRRRFGSIVRIRRQVRRALRLWCLTTLVLGLLSAPADARAMPGPAHAATGTIAHVERQTIPARHMALARPAAGPVDAQEELASTQATWSQQGALIAQSGTVSAGFGSSVAMNPAGTTTHGDRLWIELPSVRLFGGHFTRVGG